jgi:hypothetical protein
VEDSKRTFQLKLTREQKAQIWDLTKRDLDTLELSVEELEERIAPAIKKMP